jgi:hypothetical protein
MVDRGTERAGEQGIRSSGPNFPPVVYLLFVALVVVASIGWRAANLNAFSTSNDEGAYLMWAWLVHSGHPLYSETVSVSGPLFIVALDWAFDLAGVSLVTGRILVLGFLGVTLLSLAWVGELLQCRLAGLVAAVTFSLAPLSFALSRMTMGEIPAVALATLSLALALAYWRRGGWIWLTSSGLTLSLSLLIKALNPLLFLPLLWLIAARHWRSPASRRKGLTALAVWGLAGLLPVSVCLLVYDPAMLYDQAIAFRFELRGAFPWHLADNVARLSDFAQQHWGIVGLAAAGIILLTLRARWETLIPIGLWLGGALFTVLIHSPLFPHHTVILLPPLALLAGLAIAETVTMLQEQRWIWSTPGLAGGIAFLLALPAMVQANQTVLATSFGREAEAITFLKQVTRPTDNVISDNLLMPFMAGRQSPPPLGDLAQVAIDTGRQTSERLIAISKGYPVEAVANWALRLPYLDDYMDWVENNYLVRRVWDDHHVIYFGRRVPAGQIPNRVDAQVGDSIELLGYDIRNWQQAASGKQYYVEGKPQALAITLYWQANKPVNEDYTVFVQLLDSKGHLVTQHDGQPLYGYLPTDDWSPGDVIPDAHQLALPSELPSGWYQLIAGMYILETMARLPVHTAYSQSTDDSVALTSLHMGESGFQIEK